MCLSAVDSEVGNVAAAAAAMAGVFKLVARVEQREDSSFLLSLSLLSVFSVCVETTKIYDENRGESVCVASERESLLVAR